MLNYTLFMLRSDQNKDNNVSMKIFNLFINNHQKFSVD